LLEQLIPATQEIKQYSGFVGRGTTAVFVALRGLVLANGWQSSGEVILPDIICSTVLDAVLLAGFRPVLADVTEDRFELDLIDLQAKITSSTRAIITTHVFGLISDTQRLRQFNLPIIEDAVQGFGGATPAGAKVGTLGDISIISFDSTKMIGGRGGVVMTDNPALAEAIEQVNLTPVTISDNLPIYRHYLRQLAPLIPSLLCEFNANDQNINQIMKDWQQLEQNVALRNEKAAWYSQQLSDLPLKLSTLQSTDAVWRYTIATQTRPQANRILRGLQFAGLSGSHLYPALSSIYAPDSSMRSAEIAPRLVNLWVNDEADKSMMAKSVQVIRRALSTVR
jgi:dTDP-4-amino-4,6-dideoxygalactose transaminase